MIITILTITTHSIQIKTNKITNIWLYGQEQYGDSDTWWAINYNNYDNYIITQSVPYVNTRQWIDLEFDTVIVKNIKLEFKMKLIDLPTYCSISNSIKELRIRTKNITLKYEIITENENNEKYIRYYIETEEIDNVSINRLSILTDLNILSSRIKIYDFELIINDEIYEITKDVNNSKEELSNAESEYKDIINDVKPNEDEVSDVISDKAEEINNIIINIENPPQGDYPFFIKGIWDINIIALIIGIASIFSFFSFIVYGRFT